MSKHSPKHMATKSKVKESTRGRHLTEKVEIAKNNMTLEKTRIIFKGLIPIILILIIAIGGTIAFLMTQNSVENSFVLGQVKPEIKENFNSANKVKEDVYVKNSGNVPIFVRTAIIINWKDKEGRVLDLPPAKDVDYSISFSTSTNWIKSQDGYYYYKNALDVNDDTDILIEECIQTREYEDRTLEVNIIVQGIQAEPTNAVEEAWGVNVVTNCISLGGE